MPVITEPRSLTLALTLALPLALPLALALTLTLPLALIILGEVRSQLMNPTEVGLPERM